MLPNILLIGFLNTFLATLSKKHLLNHVKQFVSLFVSCIFSFVEQIRKNVLQNEIKDLTFKVFLFFKLFPIRDQTFTSSPQKGGKKDSKFVACLEILLSLNNRSILHFSEWEG